MGTLIVAAAAAKNEFGKLLDEVLSGSRVVITKYDRPRVVMMSVEEFEDLTASARSGSLAELSARYDTWLDSVQGPEKSAARRKAFNAKPEAIGRAAVGRVKKSK